MKTKIFLIIWIVFASLAFVVLSKREYELESKNDYLMRELIQQAADIDKLYNVIGLSSSSR